MQIHWKSCLNQQSLLCVCTPRVGKALIQLHPLSVLFAGRACYFAVTVKSFRWLRPPNPAFLSFPRQFLSKCCHTPNHASFLDEAIHFLPVKFCRNVRFSVPKEQEQSRKRQSPANAAFSEPWTKLHLMQKAGFGKDFMKDAFHIYTKLISTCPNNTAFQLGWKTILFY